MATKSPSFAREVLDVPVTEELGESFLAYSLSVITSRAIPDITDGLKPVQRRILYSMREMRLYPDRPHRKCAHVVGDVMAKFHPHGDSAIYDTLVRLGQDFARQVTVIDPQGNFGSLDDPPAAYRYTECRLTPAALDLLGEIDEETVEWHPTYDGETLEPSYLPALLPNLLVNGTSGIAVGMATNMAPHNLGEIYKAIELVMTRRRPKPTAADLMEVAPGPDFPSGGVMLSDGLEEVYNTGRGSLRIRAKANFTRVTRSRQGIEITELPYLVGTERVIAKIKQLRDAQKLGEVSDVKNLSDRKSGIRLLIELKTGYSPEIVLEKLYRLTPLEETFSVNNVVLVDGVPTTVNFYDMCLAYIGHRLDIIVRRSEFRLRNAQDRLHIVDGLLIAIDNIDKVVKIIRSSSDSQAARSELMTKLKLSEIQAEHILELKLRRLTSLAYDELVAEREQLKATIAQLTKILGSDKIRRKMVLDELAELTERLSKPRRTQIVDADSIANLDDLEAEAIVKIQDDPCVVTVSTTGLVSREPQGNANTYSASKHDLAQSTVMTSLAKYVYAISNKGRLHRRIADDIPEIGGRSRGKSAEEIFGCAKGETVLGVFADTTETVLVITANGRAKRVLGSELSGINPGRPVIALQTRDELVCAFEVNQNDHVVSVASDAQCLRTDVSNVSIQGPGAKGVAFMALKGSAKIIAAGPATPNGVIVCVSDTGTAKSTLVDDIPTKGRGTAGVRLAKLQSESRLDYSWIGEPSRASIIVGSADSPTKPSAKPKGLSLRPTKRDGVMSKTPDRILQIGSLRW